MSATWMNIVIKHAMQGVMVGSRTEMNEEWWYLRLKLWWMWARYGVENCDGWGIIVRWWTRALVGRWTNVGRGVMDVGRWWTRGGGRVMNEGWLWDDGRMLVEGWSIRGGGSGGVMDKGWWRGDGYRVVDFFFLNAIAENILAVK